MVTRGRIYKLEDMDALIAWVGQERVGAATYPLVAVYPGAIIEARKLKPSIPLVGHCGIPVRDEIELEKRL